MPSQKKQTSSSSKTLDGHIVFFPLLTLTFILWLLYRLLFVFPTWFDETLGKGIFFGLPVWLYLVISRSEAIYDSFARHKIQSGLLLGIAVGGIFGFTAAIMALLQSGETPQAADLFMSQRFWGEFFLALLTGFWETLLFYSFIMVVIQEKYARLSLLTQLTLVVVIFMTFHLPNIILRFSGEAILFQVFILSLFALGQALLFAARRNFYALVISHAIWGMVLLVHGQ